MSFNEGAGFCVFNDVAVVQDIYKKRICEKDFNCRSDTIKEMELQIFLKMIIQFLLLACIVNLTIQQKNLKVT